jgi:hypothetical protein
VSEKAVEPRVGVLRNVMAVAMGYGAYLFGGMLALQLIYLLSQFAREGGHLEEVWTGAVASAIGVAASRSLLDAALKTYSRRLVFWALAAAMAVSTYMAGVDLARDFDGLRAAGFAITVLATGAAAYHFYWRKAAI